jgi:hypothetical protein
MHSLGFRDTQGNLFQDNLPKTVLPVRKGGSSWIRTKKDRKKEKRFNNYFH